MVLIAVDSFFQLVCAFNIAHHKYSKEKITIIIKRNKVRTFYLNLLNKNMYVENILIVDERLDTHAYEIFWQIKSIFLPKSATRDMFSKSFLELDIKGIIASITWIPLLSPIYRSFDSVEKVYLVEEGLGTYVKQERMFVSGSKLSKLKYILLRRRELVKNSILCFIMPDYIEDSGNRYEKMPNFDAGVAFADSIVGFFGEQKDINVFKDSKYIYFDQIFYQPNDDVKAKMDIDSQIDAVKKLLVKYYKAVIKAHPRHLNDDRYSSNESKTTIPWEAISLAIDSDDKVLVSVTSTSIVTPKIMQNKEPMVICLIELFKEYLLPLKSVNGMKEIDNLTSFFSHIQKSYDDPSRFMIPKDLDELKMMIEKIEGAS